MATGSIVLPLSAVVLTMAGVGLPHQRSQPAPPTLTAEDVLQRTRELYPTLTSYADSGTVTEETSGYVNRSSFRTYFVSAPRNFLFEYRQIASEYKTGQRVPLTNRIMLWMLHGHLQSWSSDLDTHQEYPEGSNQVSAFVTATAGTTGAAILVPSLIYVKANLVTTIQELGEVTMAGVETLRGRRCYKLLGIARSVYPSGQVTNVRPATVWIDAESFLIRQVFTDTPKGYPAGQVYRLTLAYEPRLNPPLPDSLFTFTVPTAQQ
jgi:outer membrane lipoprotein-sorting protein